MIKAANDKATQATQKLIEDMVATHTEWRGHVLP